MTALENLIQTLSRLPGIGPKSASRLAYHLIKTEKRYNQNLSQAIATIQDRIFPCSICGSFTETDPCPVCSDASRDRSLLCVVEEPQDVLTIQSSGAYNGLYHVLGGAISPLDGIGPEQLSFSRLLQRIKEGQFTELIIATNPTEEGDTTALYIRHILKDYKELSITRLASGLPIGGDLEYADRITLARSLRGRVTF
ncbi:recombination mediator RecR [Sphaerochaeta halotolerans]|jgi:recombination protein RecR|uniref:Recombination protein RecR n=1 Tax=Sphaerochaeta halotolerans TaxID=2293840 RepID=A0A372MLK3_9SPIR|nr:recombination mediator RecR [Sphaerochaeta halotolerans]MBG0766353.1 recombination protein RecR [Spirochaetaceae bacterium]MDK2859567.1 recombination protein RecR [Sphaerochaeta sp.]MDN5334344.1 recombination protein RecR [Sphaerochaeta sp.]MXI87243.1 recombination protein RecR [Sphaerochaeta halotolerans]RFU96050.1 recombination protein RecR [Sphaerochaeta halotolerans]